MYRFGDQTPPMGTKQCLFGNTEQLGYASDFRSCTFKHSTSLLPVIVDCRMPLPNARPKGDCLADDVLIIYSLKCRRPLCIMTDRFYD